LVDWLNLNEKLDIAIKREIGNQELAIPSADFYTLFHADLITSQLNFSSRSIFADHVTRLDVRET
jgi:hypothetical protein